MSPPRKLWKNYWNFSRKFLVETGQCTKFLMFQKQIFTKPSQDNFRGDILLLLLLLFISDTAGKHKQHEARSIVNTNTHTQKKEST